ncbi:glutathione S-transferase [Natronocella acetinitrilica]|uniref:Glutathione S-transferase n=1 Tax=Natronocella acetinitrilica TaxID=414046 RepID=A0AAE3KHJ7_9GAMM|nr:glutathione S-transferase [Natronocella acetinitrilica]
MTEQAPSLRLYHSPDSASVVVKLALEASGTAYDCVVVDRAAGEQRGDTFRALNPQGLVPVLIDDGDVLYETGAILLQLVDTHGAPGPRPGAAKRAQFYKWLFFLSNTVHADLRVAFYTHRYTVNPDCVEAVRAALCERLRQHFTLLDSALADSSGDWLMGREQTVADFYLAACARWAALYPLDAPVCGKEPARLKHVRVWLKRLEQVQEVKRVFASDGVSGDVFTKPDYPPGIERLLRSAGPGKEC